MSRFTLALLLAAVCSLLGAQASAEPPAMPRGMPALNVAALASSAERLYVGGFDDGLFIVEPSGEAHHFEDAALSPHINALAWSERDHVLWLGTARGLTRCRMAPTAACTRIGPSNAVHALHLQSSGSVVAGGDAGLTFVTGESSQAFGKKQGAPFRSVWAIAEADDGTLLVGTTSGLFWGNAAAFAQQGANLKRAAIVTGSLPDDWVTALLHEKGRLYVGTYNAGTASFHLEADQLRSDGVDPLPGYVNPAGLFALGEGNLAIATMNGLRSGTPGRTNMIQTNARDITALVSAPKGGYWIGTRQGLEWLPALLPLHDH
jgi:ligand-binding sensor domain-containing protein